MVLIGKWNLGHNTPRGLFLRLQFWCVIYMKSGRISIYRAISTFLLTMVLLCCGSAKQKSNSPSLDTSWATKQLDFDDKRFLSVEQALDLKRNDMALRTSLVWELEMNAMASPSDELAVFQWAYVATSKNDVELAIKAKKALTRLKPPYNIRTARLLLLIDYWLSERGVGSARSKALRKVGKDIVKRYPTDKALIRRVAEMLSWSDDLDDLEASVRMIRSLAKLEPKKIELLFDIGLYQTYVYEKSVRKSDLILARDSFVRFANLMDSSKYIYQTEKNTKMLVRAANSWIDTLNKALVLKKSFNPERKGRK